MRFKAINKKPSLGDYRHKNIHSGGLMGFESSLLLGGCNSMTKCLWLHRRLSWDMEGTLGQLQELAQGAVSAGSCGCCPPRRVGLFKEQLWGAELLSVLPGKARSRAVV